LRSSASGACRSTSRASSSSPWRSSCSSSRRP
jgi:hypothetical protein